MRKQEHHLTRSQKDRLKTVHKTLFKMKGEFEDELIQTFLSTALFEIDELFVFTSHKILPEIELRVLRYWEGRLPNKTIARRLRISIGQVRRVIAKQQTRVWRLKKRRSLAGNRQVELPFLLEAKTPR